MCQSADGQNSERERAWRIHRRTQTKVDVLLLLDHCPQEEWASAIEEFNRTWRVYMDIVNAEIPKETK